MQFAPAWEVQEEHCSTYVSLLSNVLNSLLVCTDSWKESHLFLKKEKPLRTQWFTLVLPGGSTDSDLTMASSLMWQRCQLHLPAVFQES